MLFVFSFWFFRSPIKSGMTGVWSSLPGCLVVIARVSGRYCPGVWSSLPGCLVVIAGLTGNLLSKVVNHGRRCVKVVAED